MFAGRSRRCAVGDGHDRGYAQTDRVARLVTAAVGDDGQLWFGRLPALGAGERRFATSGKLTVEGPWHPQPAPDERVRRRYAGAVALTGPEGEVAAGQAEILITDHRVVGVIWEGRSRSGAIVRSSAIGAFAVPWSGEVRLGLQAGAVLVSAPGWAMTWNVSASLGPDSSPIAAATNQQVVDELGSTPEPSPIVETAGRAEESLVDAPSTSRRRGRVFVIVGVMLALAGGGAYGYQRFTADDVFASPETVELPPTAEDPKPTADYLASDDGRRLTAFVAAVDPMRAGDGDEAQCKTTVARLDTLGTPDQVFSAASGIPDRPTADMAVSHVAAASRFLGHCLEGGEAPSPDEVRFTGIVLDRRLAGLR